MTAFERLFDTSDFPARWNCGAWSTELGWLHICSDIAIAVAYFAIPLSLVVMLVKRRDVPFPYLLALFSAFILACGLTHAIEALIFWHPVYRLSGLMKLLTACVSIVTAVVLAGRLPILLALPGLHRLNVQLGDALARERSLTQELVETRDALEKRSSQMISRGRRLAEALASAHGVACRWNIESGELDWELGFAESAKRAGVPASVVLESWRGVLRPDDFASLVAVSAASAESMCPFDFEADLAGAPSIRVRLAASPEPAVAGMPRMAHGLFRFLPDDGSARGR